MKKKRRQSFFAVLLALVLAISGFTIPGGETVKAASDEADFTVEDGVLTGYTGNDEDGSDSIGSWRRNGYDD